MKLTRLVAVSVAAVFNIAAAQDDTNNSSLPMVDLGYEVHRAIQFNESGQYYNFSNIRFAQAPVGDLRWAYPKKPAGRNTDIQDGGNQPITCPPASPVWQLIGVQFMAAFANGDADSFNYTNAMQVAQQQIQSAQSGTPDPTVTEDCLFLDVMAPKYNFDAVRGYLGSPNTTTGNRSSPGSSAFTRKSYNGTGSGNDTTPGDGSGKAVLAPVIVWIYGGGYVFGSKTLYGSPAGLMSTCMQAQANGTNSTTTGSSGNSTEGGCVFVAMNYRTGAFGWLGGPSLQAEGGVSNAALYDQRLAIQWVREKIHLFGGDPNRITLVGESAGGGSIMHQITAYGGAKGVNFQRAVIQSPGWMPISSQFTQENTTQTFLSLLNVSSIAEARRLNSTALMRANAQQVAASPYGSYTFGPVYDGVFVTAQPGLAFLTGQYAKEVDIMAGHNTNEGVLFSPPYVKNDADIMAWMVSQYPQGAPAVGQYILDNLYPPVYDGSLGYTSPVTRVIRMVTEQIFTCNTNYMARAKGNQTYNYEFQVGAALHGADIPYTFYNGGGAVAYPEVATTLQSYITQFAATGNPNRPGLPTFPIQGGNYSMAGLNTTGVNIMPDDTANERCKWWQKYLYT